MNDKKSNEESKFLDQLFIEFFEFLINVRTQKKGAITKSKKSEYQKILDVTKKNIKISETNWKFNIYFSKNSFYNHWYQFIYCKKKEEYENMLNDLNSKNTILETNNKTFKTNNNILKTTNKKLIITNKEYLKQFEILQQKYNSMKLKINNENENTYLELKRNIIDCIISFLEKPLKMPNKVSTNYNEDSNRPIIEISYDAISLSEKNIVLGLKNTIDNPIENLQINDNNKSYVNNSKKSIESEEIIVSKIKFLH